MRGGVAGLEPQQRAVPHRGHQGAAGPPRAGGRRELAPDLQRPDGTAQARRDAGRHRRCGKGGGRLAGQGGLHGEGGGDRIRLGDGMDQADARQRGQGAWGGYGLLLDIGDVANPRRMDAVSDSNFSYWHSATFNNDGTKLLFSDEWGGGGQPKCRATDKHEWGADAIFTLADNRLKFQSYYKMSAPQTQFENCVAHNGSLIPIPGRDIMVQAWYQGGISVFDWTDPAHPKEIAFFDRGPADATKMGDAGSWSAYWYNGYIYSSEIARGLDVFELTPSGLISHNELEAAKLVHLDYFNTQDKPKITWPASFVVARAYVDQLERSNGLAVERVKAVREALDRAEKSQGQARRDALTQLATGLGQDAATSSDQAKVQKLAGVVTELANTAATGAQ